MRGVICRPWRAQGEAPLVRGFCTSSPVAFLKARPDFPRIHSVQEPSAKVHLSMVALLEAVKKRDVPAELKCRQIFPTDGTKSSSLWDAPDVESLQSWLDEFMVADCNSEVFQVQEESAYGISAELTRIRATERVTANTRATAAAVQERTKVAAADAQHRMGEIDAKLKVSEHAAAAIKSARDSSSIAAKRTAEMFGRVGQQAQSSYAKALENEKVAAAATAINTNVSAGWKSLSTGFGSLVKGQNAAQTGPPRSAPQADDSNSADNLLGRKSGGEASAVAGSPEIAAKPTEEKRSSLFTLDDLDEAERTPKASKAVGS